MMLCRGFEGPRGQELTVGAMEAAFREHGIPARMRRDNGVWDASYGPLRIHPPSARPAGATEASDQCGL